MGRERGLDVGRPACRRVSQTDEEDRRHNRGESQCRFKSRARDENGGRMSRRKTFEEVATI